MEKMRINKLISRSGIASRREAEDLIRSKKVFVNGKLAELGQQVSLEDEIIVDGKMLEKVQEFKYYVLNKPKKTICTLKDNFSRTLVTDLIDDDSYLFPVGRLDYDTTGVLLITNDGELSNKLTHPSNNVIRIYRARLDEPLDKKQLQFLNGSNVMVNGKLSEQSVEHIESKSYLVTLTQGSYHHVKKIFESVERNVLDLKRTHFAGITCEKMRIGEYRKLKSFEVQNLKKLVNIK